MEPGLRSGAHQGRSGRATGRDQEDYQALVQLTAAPVVDVRNPYCRHGDIHDYCAYSREQEHFHSSAAFETFFGGAAGPGKTISGFAEGLRQHEIPAHRALFIRRTLTELDQVIELSHTMCPPYGADYNKSSHKWTFPRYRRSAHAQVRRGRTMDGATYTFGYCKRDIDKYRYQGRVYNYIFWDELTQFATDAVYTYLFLRCRPFVQGVGLDSYIRSGSNPGGPGHGWVKARFIEGRTPNRVYDELVEDPLTHKRLTYTREFVPATLDSNDILMNTTNYEVFLLAYPDPELRRAMRHGDWDIAAGMMFAELRDGVHRVAARPPLAWTRKQITMDWGYEHFTVVGWHETTSGVADHQPHSWQYRELVINKTVAPLVAQMILERTPAEEKIDAIVCDSNAWAVPADGGPSPAEQIMNVFQQRKWQMRPTVKGAGSRARGWQLLHEYFYPKRKGGPLMRVMDNCPVTWLQLTTLARGIEPHDVEDLEPHQVDDAGDMIRYFVQSRPVPARLTEAEILMQDEDLDFAMDPATYEAQKIEQLRAVGFPAVRDRPPTKRRRKRR